MDKVKDPGIFLKCFKWLGRVVGFIFSAFFMLFLVGEGIPGILEHGLQNSGWILLYILLLLGTVAGYVISYFRGKTGGLVMICGGCAMAAFQLATGGMNDFRIALLFGLPFLVSGLAALTCWKKKTTGKA